jgi:hypothetical protein
MATTTTASGLVIEDTVRSFFRFLRQRGDLEPDLAAAVQR